MDDLTDVQGIRLQLLSILLENGVHISSAMDTTSKALDYIMTGKLPERPVTSVAKADSMIEFDPRRIGRHTDDRLP